MRLLVFSDVHGSEKALQAIESKAKRHRPDVLVNAGDLTIFEQDIGRIISRLDKLSRPIISIHGNHESYEALLAASVRYPRLRLVHGAYALMEGVLFIGHGGGGFSRTDKEFDRTARAFEKESRQQNHEKVVLITHQPPYDTRLDKVNGSHAGNKSYRRFIERYSPEFVISGHLHENAGISDMLGKTKLLNPGPDGRIIEIR